MKHCFKHTITIQTYLVPLFFYIWWFYIPVRWILHECPSTHMHTYIHTYIHICICTYNPVILIKTVHFIFQLSWLLYSWPVSEATKQSKCIFGIPSLMFHCQAPLHNVTSEQTNIKVNQPVYIQHSTFKHLQVDLQYNIYNLAYIYLYLPSTLDICFLNVSVSMCVPSVSHLCFSFTCFCCVMFTLHYKMNVVMMMKGKIEKKFVLNSLQTWFPLSKHSNIWLIEWVTFAFLNEDNHIV